MRVGYCSHFTNEETSEKSEFKHCLTPKPGCAHLWGTMSHLWALSPLGVACSVCLTFLGHRGCPSSGNCPCCEPLGLPHDVWVLDPTTNALIWPLQPSAFSSQSLGSNQEGIKEGGNQNKVKSMASQLLAKFEESSRNPSILRQVSPVKHPLTLPSWWPEPAEKPANVRQVLDFRYASQSWLKRRLELLLDLESDFPKRGQKASILDFRVNVISLSMTQLCCNGRVTVKAAMNRM